MATRKSATKPVAEVEEVAEEVSAEPTAKQIINDGIVAVVEATGIEIQKARYKAMRAIAYQAFVEAIEAGDFDALVQRAIANVDDLPTGWEIEKPETAEKPATKVAPAKAPAKKAPAKAAAKPAATARKRPQR